MKRWDDMEEDSVIPAGEILEEEEGTALVFTRESGSR